MGARKIRYKTDADASYNPSTNSDTSSGAEDNPSPVVAPAPVQSGRSTRASAGDIGDWRVIYNAHDQGRKDGSIRVNATKVKTKAPSHFSQIKKIQDTNTRNQWYKAHFTENDGLFDFPDVLRAIPQPENITDAELKYLHTLYTEKRDGTKKARTVLGAGKGELEDMDLNYGRTFSPTGRTSTFRFLCSLAGALGLTVRGGDVKQAYKMGNWPSWMKKLLSHMPAGYNKYYDGKKYCCEVGNLYGHPVAGRNWWETFRQHILKDQDGFKQSEHDPCLFINIQGKEVLYLLVYVDDVVWFTNSERLNTEFETKFGEHFDWTNFGTDLHDYLSIDIAQTETEVTLGMESYITRMYEDYYGEGKPHHSYSTPADTDLPKVVHQAAKNKDSTMKDTALAKRFRRLCMQLLYCAMHGRPDIMSAVGLLTRVQAWPSLDLMHRAERILIYLYGEKGLKLHYTRLDMPRLEARWAPRVTVEGAADADWALAHSTSAYVFGLGTAATSWATVKQQSIAISTRDAEIHAGSLAACEAIHLRGLSEETGHAQVAPTVLLMDSSSAIDLAYDPMMVSKTKHIERRDLFIRELVEREIVKPIYVKTEKNTADILTKPLEKRLFCVHRATLFGTAP